jgi:hypothetical protein
MRGGTCLEATSKETLPAVREQRDVNGQKKSPATTSEWVQLVNRRKLVGKLASDGKRQCLQCCHSSTSL